MVPFWGELLTLTTWQKRTALLVLAFSTWIAGVYSAAFLGPAPRDTTAAATTRRMNDLVIFLILRFGEDSILPRASVIRIAQTNESILTDYEPFSTRVMGWDL